VVRTGARVEGDETARTTAVPSAASRREATCARTSRASSATKVRPTSLPGTRDVSSLVKKLQARRPRRRGRLGARSRSTRGWWCGTCSWRSKACPSRTAKRRTNTNRSFRKRAGRRPPSRPPASSSPTTSPSSAFPNQVQWPSPKVISSCFPLFLRTLVSDDDPSSPRWRGSSRCGDGTPPSPSSFSSFTFKPK